MVESFFSYLTYHQILTLTNPYYITSGVARGGTNVDVGAQALLETVRLPPSSLSTLRLP